MTTVSNAGLVTAAFSSLLGLTSSKKSGPSVSIDALKIYPWVVPVLDETLSLRFLRNGSCISLKTSKHDTIKQVKLKLQDEIGLPVAEQILVFQDKQLEDTRALSDYRIEGESKIHVYRRFYGGQIYVKTLTGKTITLGSSAKCYDRKM